MKKILSLFLAVICLTFCSCGGNTVKKEKYTDYSFDYFDTLTSIIGYEKNKDDFLANCNIIKEKLGYYHKLFNIYNKFDGVNNLASINEAQKPVTVDKEIIKMLEFSREMHGKTNGKVNVAMGSVLSIWHNYRSEGMNDPENAKLPTENELSNAFRHTDISNLLIDKTNNTVFLKDAEMSLDVGAVAKGYAVEQTAIYMREKGMDGYILNVGGNVKIVGDRPDGEKWKIGIENPAGDKEQPYAEYLLLSNNMSLVTSGSYQRFYTVDGKNYHHIIDPETLMPSDYFSSVSVLTEDSGLADALSTALFTMNFEEGKRLIKKFPETEVLWIFPNGEKKYSENFKNYCS